MNIQQQILNFENKFCKKEIPFLKTGDVIKIFLEISEGNKKRIQQYTGTIIAKKNTSINTTINVRKVINQIAVEKIFLIHSPIILRIEILESIPVKRSKLYFLRNFKKMKDYK
uniref:50S ribosomal protein L19, chloroplastic n=1 Tax=Nitzschia sp. PL3-2 TaxID=2083271 RepID=A0A2Z5ZA59_9STRA|nr:ribosomal protein L19 [Nitzschia sp. PL3-2]